MAALTVQTSVSEVKVNTEAVESVSPTKVETVSSTKATNPSKKNFRNLRIEVPKVPIRELNSLSVGSANYYSTDIQVKVKDVPGNSPTTVKNVDDEGTYGTHYPNRIFVGHLPGKASAGDLANFFCSYGTVLEGKIVLDSFGRSRRFGFVTFASHDDVENVLSKNDLYLKGKKINIGPAVKKMFAAEFSPPYASLESSDSDTPSPSEECLSDEKIITVPPVNEKIDASGSPAPRLSNVWQKVNVKRKTSAKTLTPCTPCSPAVAFTQPYIHPQQYISPQTTTFNYQQPMIYPIYTIPYEQVFNYPVYHYANGEANSFGMGQNSHIIQSPQHIHGAPIYAPQIVPQHHVMAYQVPNGTMYFTNRVGVV
ncbi:protein boule-like isoform X3 [Hydra vulgaris]|uniref:Protein boule-like isoform X3 n=1 Tax=Hydra vulgaris TaxID=6087 RepID=A0ABM4BP41_HYDVU